MKKQITITAVLFLFILVLAGCNNDLENKFTFQNHSLGKVLVNFRGQLYSVDAGATFTIADIPQGTYTYSTTYQLPQGTTSSTTEGDVSGSVVFVASTRILVVYSSTFYEGAYVLYATISNSDDQTVDTGTTP